MSYNYLHTSHVLRQFFLTLFEVHENWQIAHQNPDQLFLQSSVVVSSSSSQTPQLFRQNSPRMVESILHKALTIGRLQSSDLSSQFAKNELSLYTIHSMIDLYSHINVIIFCLMANDITFRTSLCCGLGWFTFRTSLCCGLAWFCTLSF